MAKLTEKEQNLLRDYDWDNCPNHCKKCEEECLNTSRRDCVDNLNRTLSNQI